MPNGKAKGNGFEVLVGKRLSSWLTEERDAKQLIRTLGSGGQALRLIRTTEPWSHVGDLAANGPEARRFREHFGVECKHHKVIDWWHEFTCRDVSIVGGWWAKIQEECQPHHLVPLLIMRQNFKPIMVGFPTLFLHPEVAFSSVPCITLEHLGVTFVPLDEFLKHSVEVYYHYAEGWKARQERRAQSDPCTDGTCTYPPGDANAESTRASS